MLLTLIFILIAITYLRGWFDLRSTSFRTSAWRAFSFVVGLVLIWIAIASPIAALDHELLTAHMLQHLLLMTLAPPLIWLGEPVGPVLRGGPLVLLAMIALAIDRPLRKPRKIACAASGLLARCICSVGDLARPGSVCTGNEIRSVAHVRSRIFSRCRPHVLVAGGSAMAQHLDAGSLDHSVFIFCNHTVRHPFRIPGLLRPRSLLVVLVLIAPPRLFRSRRSAMCSGADVDVRDDCLSDRRNCRGHASAFSAEISRACRVGL
jgi:Cytochrome c oxidase caa3 assembly factor (Caa3_CtaG)